MNEMTEREIKSLVKYKVVEALKNELEEEGVLKELWETCLTEREAELATKTLRTLILKIARLPL